MSDFRSEIWREATRNGKTTWVSVAGRSEPGIEVGSSGMAFGNVRKVEVIFPDTGEIMSYAASSVSTAEPPSWALT